VKRIVALVAIAVAVFGTARPARAADGRQSPDPTLEPNVVATSSAAFALQEGAGVTCDGTGAEGWRANTFIVDKGVDVSRLDFSVPGLPAGWIGADFDSTSDGTVAAPLFLASGAAVNIIPAAKPAGQINPSALAGFTFDPATWKLAAGEYQIGFACTGPTSEIRQWWATAVTTATPSSSPSPVMTSASAAGALPATTMPPTATAVAPPTTAAGVGAPASTTPARESDAGSSDAAAAKPAASATGGPSDGGWSPLEALGVVAIAFVVVLVLVAFLLARSARTRRPPAVATAHDSEGTPL
jgi:hypothetical protein